MAEQINQKDANQDQEIFLLKHRIEDAEKVSEELRDRVRKLERWVWGAGAVITAAITLIGFIAAVDANSKVENGRYGSPNRKSCYNFRVVEINRVLDGDTIDVTIDLGFDLFKKERVRVAGVDTPEKRTRDLEEKALGIDATNWLKEKLEGALAGDDDLVIRTELVGGVGKYGRLLGWLYLGDAAVSLNEEMIEEGYAWAYDGGTKQKDFEELREIRREHGTLV